MRPLPCPAALALALALAALLAPASARAFCGFYVAKADADLFNQASKVVFARHDGKSVITMVNDYQGALQEFALVVPVPSVLERGQIHVGETALVDHLDAYTAPRLVEYFDEDPCRIARELQATAAQPAAPQDTTGTAALGVKIEAEYTVGEYDIVILSAAQSEGLLAWLRQEGYRLPAGAEPVLAGYLAAGMKFFLARVDLAEQSKLGYSYLRPLQIAFESADFMLPIRLGMLNATGPQELLVYLLTRAGRVEAANYRTIAIPSEVEVPLFVEGEFGRFYGAMFDALVARENMRAVFLEYAWDMTWCDPCAADPLSFEELRALGAFWILEQIEGPDLMPQPRGTVTPEVFVTRLHLRYDGASFQDDLRFRETADRSNFQGRYVLRHPWRGEARCEAARAYLGGLPQRFEQEAHNLARLTRWPVEQIRAKMEAGGQSFTPVDLSPDRREWWEKLWPD
ncbi:MAG: conserved rane protein of unknown function [Geminicoccaceae bacterium]|nr:conserved rane protein of unknown function [Geminicoccaceae bacterium]